MKLPIVSVNIPLIANGDASIVLSSLKKVKYPKHLIEIIIVEGNNIAKQRNRAMRCSKGEIIYLLDNDSEVNPNVFNIIAKEFKNPVLAALGGPSLIPQKGGNYMNRLIGYALETYFGAMRMRYRYSRQNKNSSKSTEYQLIGANLALRRSFVLRMNGFDERIIPNEETELLRRLKLKGYQLRYNEKFFIYRYQRKNIYFLAKQFYHYGTGRMKQMIKRSSIEDTVFLVPIFFLFYLILLPFYHPLWLFFPLFLYTILAVITSCKASIKYKRLDLLLTMPFIFPIIHLSYANGLVKEYLTQKSRIIVFYPKRRKTTAIKKVYIYSSE